MIDLGLVMSALTVILSVSLANRVVPLRTENAGGRYLDVVVAPAVAGIAVGRIVTLLLDDPGAIGKVRDMLIVRSGVEFWPGLIAATVVAAVVAPVSVRSMDRLADLIPLTMIGYAAYEAACLFRDGCYGPSGAIGLRPKGIETTMVPIGLLMAVAIALAAVAVLRLGDRWPSSAIVTGGGAMLGLVRSVGSIWLPHVSTGLTRQHATSIVVTIVLSLASAVLLIGNRRGRSLEKVS